MSYEYIQKPTHEDKSALMDTADALARRYYKLETPYCEARSIGAYPWKTDYFEDFLIEPIAISCGGQLEWAHIFTRGVKHLRYEPYNKLILCTQHHRYWTHHPVEWTRMLEAYFPDRLAEAEANRYKFWKTDYRGWIKYFREQLKQYE